MTGEDRELPGNLPFQEWNYPITEVNSVVTVEVGLGTQSPKHGKKGSDPGSSCRVTLVVTWPPNRESESHEIFMEPRDF